MYWFAHRDGLQALGGLQHPMEGALRREGLWAALLEKPLSSYFSANRSTQQGIQGFAFFPLKHHIFGQWHRGADREVLSPPGRGFFGCCQVGCSSAFVPCSDSKNISDFAAGSALLPDSDVRASLMLINAMTQWINTVLGKAVNYTEIKQKNKGSKAGREATACACLPPQHPPHSGKNQPREHPCRILETEEDHWDCEVQPSAHQSPVPAPEHRFGW